MKKNKITLKDISLATGYSINTISRALRDKDDIALSSREHIKYIAEELGYIHNMSARSLRLGYTNTIAVILSDISNPHFAILMKEIEERAREKGYFTYLIHTNEDVKMEYEAINHARKINVDGIILCPTQKNSDNVEYLKSCGIPFVLIGRRFPDIQTNYVICNDHLGGYQVASYLLDQGHRDVLVLTAQQSISSANERLSGFQDAFKERGITFDKKLVQEVSVTTQDCAIVLGNALQKKHFTAIFAFSDLLAWASWVYLRDRGYSVPEDISLVGFDYIQSRIKIPIQLCTIGSQKSNMSVHAVDILINKIKIEEEEFEICILETHLVKGETVKKLNP
ncbi:MAG: LacI family transcriptional regulator [Clostridiales bacterium]|nr:LacI family transcriptional regulator [Clostridiales bacterium]